MLALESASLSLQNSSSTDRSDMSMLQAISSIISISVMSNMQYSSELNLELGFSENRDVLNWVSCGKWKNRWKSNEQMYVFNIF